MIRNFKLAARTLKAARWRAYLTILGVVVGVSSVVTIVSIGDGVKQQVLRQVSISGSDIITVRSGHLVDRDESGNITKINYNSLLTSGSLSRQDLTVIRKTDGVANAVPFGIVSGVPAFEKTTYKDAVTIGTSSNLLTVAGSGLAYGSMFTDADSDRAVAVLGARVAENLFKENAPIGKSFVFRGQKIVVRGVMDTQPQRPQDLGIDYNHAIFLPLDFASDIAGGQTQMYQILVQPVNTTNVVETSRSISSNLLKAHGGSDDFTVLSTQDNLAIASETTNLLTALIAAMAGISIVVGGIGVMNIMLVSVSERTYEIGVRKSLGATTHQIRAQFLAEAILLSGFGGIAGVIVSLLANYVLRVTTNLEPTFNATLYGYAVLGAIIIGVIFGMAPAIKAAHKDPIESLRRAN